MPKMGSFDISEYKKLQANLKKIADPVMVDNFMKECLAEVAMEVLRRVIRKTPVAKTIRILQNVTDEAGNNVRYKSGKNKGKLKQKSTVIHTGGTLRRGWIAKSQSEAEASKDNSPDENEMKEYVYKLRVEKLGQSYVVWIVNVVEYASFVEYGHRQTPGRYVPAIGKRLKASWIPGHWCLTTSMQEVETKLPKILDAKLEDYLNQIFGGIN